MSNNNGWNVGDICYRNNEKCKIKQIDFGTNPPSVVIQVLSDGHEINTEFSKLSKPKTDKTTDTPMTEQNTNDLREIQNLFFGLSMVENDNDLSKLIPNLLPKLLFKLNHKNIHSKVQSEILQMISHISSRIQGAQNGYEIIPINQLLKMLFEHISYMDHNKSFYVSPFFINLTLTFIDMCVKIYVSSLHSMHLTTQNNNQRIAYPKINLNNSNTDSDTPKAFICRALIQSIFKLVSIMDKFPNNDQKYKIFHLFIQILPFIKYSDDNIDKNAQFFSELFQINFEKLIKNIEQKKAEMQKEKQNNQHKILKKSYDTNTDINEQKTNDSDSDDEEDIIDEDIIMDNTEEKVDIIKKLTNDNFDRITAVILTTDTPISSLSHIKLLLHHCTDFLLTRYVSHKSIENPSQLPPSPGLSKIIHQKISKNYALLTNKIYLEEIHKCIIDFLYFIGVTCQMIPIHEMFIAALVSTFNGNVEYVCSAAERLYSKIKSDANMENADIVSRLYELYLGSTDKTVRESHRRVPCGLSLKLAVITHLCKSNKGCNSFPKCVKVMFDSFFGKKTYFKLKMSGLEFTKQILINARESAKLRKLTPVFKTGLMKLLKCKPGSSDEFLQTSKIRNVVYSIIGHLASLGSAKKLFTKNMDILQLYFDRLETEKGLQESILDGLKMLKQCFKSTANDGKLLGFLLERMENKQTSNRARVVILSWLNEIFPFENAQIRMVNIFQLNYSDIHIKEYARKGLQPRISRDVTAPQTVMQRNQFKLENYPSFAEFTSIAHERILKQNRKVSDTVMREVINFAAKCLSFNAMKYSEEKENNALKSGDNIILNWLESNDETNAFRNESLYQSLKKQSKYVQFQLTKSSHNCFVGGIRKYIELMLCAIKSYQISQSKTDTLHSITFRRLVHLICICYPLLTDNTQLNELLENVLFNNDNLNVFYQRQLKDSILTRKQCSKLFAIITLLCICNNNTKLIGQYQSMLFKSIAKQLCYQLQMKTSSKNTKKVKPNDLLNGTIQQSIELDGALRALGAILSAKLQIKSNTNNISSEISLLSWLCTVFTLSKNMDLIQSSCYCLSLFGRYNISNLLNKTLISSSNTSQLCSALNTEANIITDIQNIITVCSVTPTNSTADISRISDALSLISYLTLIVKRYNKNQRHISECAIQALAAIAGGITDLSQIMKIEEFMLDLRKLSQEELQFSIGSVWANIVASVSKINANNVENDIEMKEDSTEPVSKKQKLDTTDTNNNHIDTILSQICHDQMRFGNKLARQAGCIWLLCIVRFSGNLHCVQQRLLTIQNAFINSLSDSNQFTVECASKGLAHCYEMAQKIPNQNNNNSSAGNNLLRSLMSTLGKGKRIVHKDTEIQHSEGTSTYKELVGIAKNLKQPELAYRFLDLANNNAIWNSKRGAAFSLGSLLKISTELRDKMDTIIPLLYRYKFDINPHIRSTMQNLWRSIIASDKNGDSEEAIIEKHFESIMQNVISGLQSKEWKIRASTPLAVSSLIMGKRFGEVKKYLKDLVLNLFLVIQDINSMVKKSAVSMAQTMTKLIERLVNSELTNAKYVTQTLDIIIPIIIGKGIETRSKEVQLLSVALLMKICTNKTGKHLCPHLKYLIKILLIGLSTLEPTELNYLSVQDRGSDFANKVESHRIKLSHSNPLNNALDTCIDLIDDIDTINNVIPELAQIIRGGIGLNSINASCKILVDLANKRYLHQILRKHSKKVTHALLGQITVTNSAHLKTIYSSVIGHWCAFIKRKYVDLVMQTIQNLYFCEDGSDDKRVLAGMIAYNISKYSLQIMKSNTNSKILALSFIGTHDLMKECSEYWQKCMDECGGKQMALITHLKETIQLIIATFNDSFYLRKQIAIISISDVCRLCKDDLDREFVNDLIHKILQSLPGKIWEGKIKLFAALSSVTKYCNISQDLNAEIIQCLLVQIQRKKSLQYRIAATNGFGDIIKNLKNVKSVLNECVPIIQQILTEYSAKEQRLIAQCSNTTNHSEKLEFKQEMRRDSELLMCTMKFLGNIWFGNEEMQNKYVSFVINDCYIYYLQRTDWMAQISIYKSMQSIFTKQKMSINVLNEPLLKGLIECIMKEGFADLKYTAVRHQSLCAMYQILKLVKNGNLIDDELMSAIKLKIDFIVNNDNKPIVAQQAIKLRKDIFM